MPMPTERCGLAASVKRIFCGLSRAIDGKARTPGDQRPTSFAVGWRAQVTRTADSSTDAPAQTPPLFRRALCAIDGKAGGFAAVEQAAALTGPEGELTLLVVTSYRHAGDRPAPAIGPMLAKEIVDRACSIARQAGVPANVEVEPAAPPAEVVLGWAADHDLLALGAPSSSWLGGMLVQGVADSALGSLPTSVLAARSRSGSGGYEHLLVASDGLEDSVAPLACAGAIARSHGSRVTILHALEHRRDSSSERVLAQAAALQASGTQEPDIVLKRGAAHDAIVDSAASLEASLVILGSRRRGGAHALGSVSRRVVHEAGCSVLIVAPETASGQAQDGDGPCPTS